MHTPLAPSPSGTPHPHIQQHEIEPSHSTSPALNNVLKISDTYHIAHNPHEDVAIAEQLFESLIPHDRIEELRTTIAKQLAYTRKRDNLSAMRDNNLYPKSFNVSPIRLDPHSLNDNDANTSLTEVFNVAFTEYRNTLLNAMIKTIEDSCNSMLAITATGSKGTFSHRRV